MKEFAKYKIGDKVKVNPKNDNDLYNSFRNKTLVITHVAKNISEHPGYDNSANPERLYDLKEFKTGKSVPFSLYDYELVRVSNFNA